MILLVWALAFAGIVSAQQPSSLVEAEWLKANLDNPNIRILDVSKNPKDFGKGHITNALSVDRHLDLGDTTALPPTLYPNKEQFERLMGRLGITPDTTVVAYDDNKSLYAARLTTIMEAYGHDPSKLKILNGGWVYWEGKEYPMETGPAKMPAATRYSASAADQSRLVSSSEIYRDVVLGAKPGVMLLDARPADEYQAKKIRAVRGGNVPGSINLTGANFMSDEDHRIKPLDEIRKMLTDAGFTPDKEIYVYCHSGDRSAHAHWVLRHMLGYENVRVNDSGWKGWAETLSYPAKDQAWAWQAKEAAK
ncbi:MAG: sulfurtransferase [Xanthomonadaceae bacterium]|nr:sulfurtransferase [Xanthomonadaceae bacterium]